MGGKETGGVVLAFAGFVFLVGAVKGTWRNAWTSLTGGTVSTSGKAPANTTPGGGSMGNASSNLPGSGPAPFTGAL